MEQNWTIAQQVDLRRGIQAPQVWPNALMVCGDNEAHTWKVEILDNGKPANLSGNITGSFVRQDGNTVYVTGSLTKNIAEVTFAQACYAQEGSLRGVMQITGSDGFKMTLSALIFHVRDILTDNIIDPGEVIPSLEDLLAQIDACEEATDAANDAADAANQAAQSASAVESDIESAEAARVTAEQGRVAAEQARAAAEAERVANEDERQQQLTDAINAAEADADRAEAAADAAETLVAMPPLFSDTPPTDEPTLNKLWVDTGVSPTMMRRWRGADVTTEREFEAEFAQTGKNLVNIYAMESNYGDTTARAAAGRLRVATSGEGGTWRGAHTKPFLVYGGTTYTLSVTLEAYTAGYAIVGLRECESHSFVSGMYVVFGTSPGTLSVTFTPTATMNVFLSALCTSDTVLIGDCTFADIQLEISGSATAYAEYEAAGFVSLDNEDGQIRQAGVTAGCRARQAGTGAPSPENIRAITGRESVEIRACGKNLVDLGDLYVSTSNVGMGVSGDSVRVYTTGDGGTWLGAHTPAFAIHAGTTYALSATLDKYVSGDARIGLRGSDDNTFLSGASLVFGSETGRLSIVYTPDMDDEVYLSLLCTNGTVTGGDCTFSNIQLEIGSAATAYEPHRAMGGGTVTPDGPLYGLPGAEDTVEVSVDGDVTVTRRTAVLELDGTESWAKAVFNTTWVFQHINLTPVAEGAPASAVANALCSHYDVKAGGSTSGGEQGISVSHGNYIEVCDMNYLEPDDFKSYLAAQAAAGTPVTIVYELAAPTTETPADVDPIEPQAGQLNISTDADALSATVHGSGWDTISDQTGLLATIAQLTARVAALEQAAVDESTGG